MGVKYRALYGLRLGGYDPDPEDESPRTPDLRNWNDMMVVTAGEVFDSWDLPDSTDPELLLSQGLIEVYEE